MKMVPIGACWDPTSTEFPCATSTRCARSAAVGSHFIADSHRIKRVGSASSLTPCTLDNADSVDKPGTMGGQFARLRVEPATGSARAATSYWLLTRCGR